MPKGDIMIIQAISMLNNLDTDTDTASSSVEANSLAAIALAKLFVNNNTTNLPYITEQFDAVVNNAIEALNAESKVSFDTYVAAAGAMLETTGNIELYEEFYTKVFLPILNDNNNFNGFAQVVDVILNSCKYDTFREFLFPRIIEVCAKCFSSCSYDREFESHGENLINILSIEKKVNVFEEISNLAEAEVLDENKAGTSFSQQHKLLLVNLMQEARKALNGSTKVAKLSLRILNKIQILGMNNNDQLAATFATDIWSTILEFYNSASFERKNFAYIIWSVLFQLLPDTWKEEKAWEIITFGLNCTDALLSKRSYSLLRRIVDTVATNTKLNQWMSSTPEGTNVTTSNSINDVKKNKKRRRKKKTAIDFGSTPLETWKIRFSIFGCIFECLDGIQGHLVEAVWPQFAQLCAMAKYEDSDVLLPYTYMMCDDRFISILLKKSWRNTNPSIKHWTVGAFLKYPPVKGKHWIVCQDTIAIDMLEAINSPHYFRRHIKGIEGDLLNFLHIYIQMMDSDEIRRVFLQKYIKYTSKITKNDFPLAAQMKLFTHLIESGLIVKGVVGETEIKYLRDNFTQKHLGSTLSRKIIAESSVYAIMYFSTPGKIRVSALGNFFLNIQCDILQPTSKLHQKLQSWIKQDWDITNDNIDIDGSDNKGIFENLYSNNLNKYIYSMTSYSNCSNDGKITLQNEMEPLTLAYMLSLVPDIDDRIKMISPVFKLLKKSYTHSYIPRRTLMQLFELFVGICSTASPKFDDDVDKTWNYTFLSDMLGNDGRGELLSYIEHGFDVYATTLCMDNIPIKGQYEDNNDDGNRSTIPLVLGQLLKICPSDERIFNLAFKFVENILVKIGKLMGKSQIFAINMLDEILVYLLHPFSQQGNKTQQNRIVENISDKLGKIVNVISELNYKQGKRNSKTTESKQLHVNVISEFHSRKWKILSTIFAYIDSYNAINYAMPIKINEEIILKVVEIAKDAFEGVTCTYFLPLLETVVSLFPQWHDIIVSDEGKDCSVLNVDNYLKHVTPLFKSAWVAFSEVDRNRLSSALIDTLCMLFFHEKFMLVVELHQDSSNCVAKDYIRKLTTLVKGGNANKRIMHGFAKQIFKVFSANSNISVTFSGRENNNDGLKGENVAKLYIKEIADLVLYEEPLEEHLHQQEKENFINDVHRGRLKYTLFHAHVMTFLDNMVDEYLNKQKAGVYNNSNFEESFIYELAIYLLDMNFLEEWRFENYMPNSPEHGLKLRTWQCLCVLARGVVPGKVAVEYIERTCKILDENHLPSIRYYAEIFLARCLVCDPLINVSKYILSRYNTFNIRTPTLVSLLFSTSYILPCLIKNAGAATNDQLNKLLYDIMFALFPWMGGANGQARIIAQHIVATIVNFNAENITNSPVYDVSHEKNEVLNNFHRYLTTNTDVKRMITRQVKNLTKVDIYRKCSLNGIMEGQLNMWGNIFPPDILNILKDAITTCNEELIAEDQYMYTWVAATARVSQKPKNRKERADEAARLVKETMYNADSNDVENEDDDNAPIRSFEFQRKILPWGDLDTAVEDMLSSNHSQLPTKTSREEFALSRKKQEIIVIASLVDKVPNLAGLTRTCEIFGAKKLIIPSEKFQNDDLFSSISVTAEKWLNIEYVPEIDLKNFLLSCKKDGYTLVGLEQTSNSKSIEEYNFKRKTAILLGKEQEGIPPEFIDILEDCVEIPQFGIVRSLNVHVSGSILLWEYTRQGLLNNA